MTIIGIDFSIQYPAACITHDFKEFKWVSCINTGMTKSYSKFLEDISLEYQNLEFIKIPQNKDKTTTYSSIERHKLVRYSNLINIFIENILKKSISSPIIVSIEGLAYGAKGNALIDIAQSTGMLKKSILEKVLSNLSESLFIFSPGELKNSIGAKGNAGKYEVFEKFIESNGPIVNSDLYKALGKYESDIIKDEIIKSPFSDMIDSYLAVLKIQESLK